MGRPSKQTREICEAIIADIASGLYASQVALRNGLHRHTLQHWVERGLREGASELEAWFAEAYIKAEIEVERKTIETIRAGAEPWESRKDIAEDQSGDESSYSLERKERATERGDWKAAAWFAEKRWPKRWGSRAPMNGHETAADELPVSAVLEAAESRPEDLNEIIANPTPELEEAILRNKDALLALIAAAEEKD